MTQLDDVQAFMNLELPRRRALLTVAIAGYDDDPNLGGAPAILQGAPVGTQYLRETPLQMYEKLTAGASTWTGVGAFETTAPVTYIVRDSDGDDSDDGLTEGTAFKTLQAAADKIPFHIRDAVIIRAGEHGGTGYTMPLFGAHEWDAHVWVIGDGAGIGDGFTETLASTASIAGTDKSKVVTAGGHTIDEFKGHTLIFTSGACDTYRRTVISNTATDILFVTDTDQTGNVPLSGDTFRIVRPSVVINLQAGSTGNADTVATGTSKGFPQRSADAGGGGLILAQLRMV
ncbi:MAG: hypothetical protein HRT76_14650, partial [Halieaceae bacterium]|nr:hypothetical protein [Halieaceae bacterium]